ncbi:hypothetical protein SAMN02982929_05568 [Saccharopolyspora kobensis]|uniref:Uncharacterized protein n=1 Tax=Saccharopolyspora kobensis TaxID=146035 RepID=A0A1H6E6D3_9PSEU|nr:hypothetical protein [Saccharopolyspora kobensis]SEG92445.1 hypothetical protein SAMN02982929_05568 [Saccharopolyspora kobensis]SFD37963.1 hypothetical protein SAMN05216506_10497 [Saccharopolyspora kobensis]
MPAPTDPVLLQERLSSIVSDIEQAESGWVRSPLSAHPLPIGTLRNRLHNATTWLGQVWSSHARGGPAVQRWLTDEPLGSPVPPANPRLPLRKQFRVALATAFLGASVAAGCYVLTAPLADPFFGLIPPDIFSRLPPFTERPVDSGPDGLQDPLTWTAPGSPVVARHPAPPAPEPAPPPASGPGEAVTRSGSPSEEPAGNTSPQPPTQVPVPPASPPEGSAPVAPPTTADPTTTPPTGEPTTVPPTTTNPPTTQPPTTTAPPTTTEEPTETAPTTTPEPTATETAPTNPPTTTSPPTATS